MRFRRLGAAALVVFALGSFVVACGDDDDDTSAAPNGGGDTELAEGEIPQFTVTATDDVAAKKFTFDVPSDLEGGVVQVALQNDGEELHDLQLVEVADGHTLDELLAEVGSEEVPLSDWIVAAGGPGGSAPGQTTTAVLDLAEGDYWYFCTESSGEGEEQISHAANGMAGELTVSGDSGAEMPDTDGTITARDYSFETSGLKAGTNTVTFSNEGPDQIHHALAFPIVEGKTFDEAKAALLSDEEPTGPPPIDFEKGSFTTVISSGKSQVLEMDLAAGSYVLVCFMPDKGTAGPPHAAKGMIAELKVS